MLLNRFTLILAVSLLVGCATPPEVKQSLVNKDQAYAENKRLMEQYRELVMNINQRYGQWNRFIENSLLMNQALRWATTDPDPEDAGAVTIDAELFGLEEPETKPPSEAELRRLKHGEKILTQINKIRLKGLPERKDEKDVVIFKKGGASNTMDHLVENLPSLVAAINEKVEADQEAFANDIDMSPFDDYQTNLAALRRINQMIRNYLEIDLTVKSEDIQELAEGVRSLR
jgi:hypothetical protein